MSEPPDRTNPDPVGRLPSAGGPWSSPGFADGADAGNAGSGDPAYGATVSPVVGRVPSPGVPPGIRLGVRLGAPPDARPGVPAPPPEPLPRRLRRLHRVWPDRDGNISYLLTLCVEGRARVLANEETFHRLTAFLLDSPARYGWFPRRFVVMPDHLHLIAHQGHAAVRLGQWIKALKAVVGGLERRADFTAKAAGASGNAGSGDPAYRAVGRVPSRGGPEDTGTDHPAGSGDPAYNGGAVVGRLPSAGVPATHEFTRLKRSWRWQEGYHDHKFRTPESEQRKWEYVCLNPVRYGLVERPEQWPYGGEIFHEEAGGPRLVVGTPPLLERGILLVENVQPPAEGSRPTQ